MHLVFLTAFQRAPFSSALDRKGEAAVLQSAILQALDAAGIPAQVVVQFGTIEVTARISAPDADATFAALAPVLRASPFCADGHVLLRYGAAGAAERQVSLGTQAGSIAPTIQQAVAADERRNLL